MVTLILCFLTILVGSKNMGFDVKPFLEAFNGNRSILNSGLGSDSLMNIPSIINIPNPDKNKRKNSRKKDIKIEIKQDLIKKNIQFEATARGIRVFLFNSFFYDFNSKNIDFNNFKNKKILKNTRDFLDLISQKLKNENGEIVGNIVFEGHADSLEDNPFSLAFQRAQILINQLESIENLFPLDKDLISIQSYGNHFLFKKNDSPNERAYQRKVTVSIEFLDEDDNF